VKFYTGEVHRMEKRLCHVSVCMNSGSKFSDGHEVPNWLHAHVHLTVVTDVNTGHAEELILKNRQITVHNIASKMCNLLCNAVHLVIHKNRPGRHCVLHDNAHLHMADLTVMTLATLGGEIINHPPHSRLSPQWFLLVWTTEGAPRRAEIWNR
jgi:hypothetical protein